jgi:hypothetical protein
VGRRIRIPKMEGAVVPIDYEHSIVQIVTKD